MLRLVHASFATITQLFEFKKNSFVLEPFPGYSEDQWGIKAHNRAWVEHIGQFGSGQKIIEVGGAYSSLPRYLAGKYSLEAWVGDDFGGYMNDDLWARWGDPRELPQKYPDTKYVFKPFGFFSEEYPENYFDRIFSVSTLEHIPQNIRTDVFKDMNRCLAKGGLQIHSIDIGVPPLLSTGKYHILGDKYPVLRKFSPRFKSEVMLWIDILQKSGVSIDTHIPNTVTVYDRNTLVDSPDVVYRFYPPVNAPKQYNPGASLLLIIEKK